MQRMGTSSLLAVVKMKGDTQMGVGVHTAQWLRARLQTRQTSVECLAFLQTSAKSLKFL